MSLPDNDLPNSAPIIMDVSRVPTIQGKLEKAREFECSRKYFVSKSQAK